MSVVAGVGVTSADFPSLAGLESPLSDDGLSAGVSAVFGASPDGASDVLSAGSSDGVPLSDDGAPLSDDGASDDVDDDAGADDVVDDADDVDDDADADGVDDAGADGADDADDVDDDADDDGADGADAGSDADS